MLKAPANSIYLMRVLYFENGRILFDIHPNVIPYWLRVWKLWPRTIIFFASPTIRLRHQSFDIPFDDESRSRTLLCQNLVGTNITHKVDTEGLILTICATLLYEQTYFSWVTSKHCGHFMLILFIFRHSGLVASHGRWQCSPAARSCQCTSRSCSGPLQAAKL